MLWPWIRPPKILPKIPIFVPKLNQVKTHVDKDKFSCLKITRTRVQTQVTCGTSGDWEHTISANYEICLRQSANFSHDQCRFVYIFFRVCTENTSRQAAMNNRVAKNRALAWTLVSPCANRAHGTIVFWKMKMLFLLPNGHFPRELIHVVAHEQ